VFKFLESSLAFFLEEYILDPDSGCVTLLEGEISEFVALAGTSLDDSSVDFSFLSTIDCELGNVWKRFLLGCLGNGLL